MAVDTLWLQRIRVGERRAIARAITAVENDPARTECARCAGAASGRAHVVGITGPAGAGKSTLVNALLGEFLARYTVAVVAVDPSSPFTGGAVLGDRSHGRASGERTRVYPLAGGARARRRVVARYGTCNRRA